METKEHLIVNIKEWMKYDDQIKILQNKIKHMKEQQKNLTHNLVEVMNSNEIGQIDVNNGKLIYMKKKTKQTISKKLLLSSLDTILNDPSEVLKITDHILNSRTEKIQESIRLKISK